MIIDILQRTPVWVWLLFFFLVQRGIKALRQREVSLNRLLIVPTFFLAWGLNDLLTKITISATTFTLFSGAFIISATLLYFVNKSTRRYIVYNKETGMLALPGQPITLILILIAFLTKYLLSVILTLRPEITMHHNFGLYFATVSGLIDGTFWGNIAPALSQVFKQKYFSE